MLHSVRIRTTVLAATAVGLALAAGAVALVIILERSLTAGVDRGLAQRLTDVSALVRSVAADDRLTLTDQGESLQIVGRGKGVLAATGVLDGRPPVGPVQPPRAVRVTWTQHLAGIGEAFRFTGASVLSAKGPVTIYVASSLKATAQSVTQVKRDLVIGLPVLLAFVGLTSWFIVGRALHPVEAIRAQVADIGFGGLEKRVPEPVLNDEIGRLARTMNAMLDRLHAASERQRRFVADASHELRSPLASLCTQLEVRQAYAKTGPAESKAISHALAEVVRMDRLVADLLLLARADAHRLVGSSRLVPLHLVVLEEAARPSGRDAVAIDTSRVEPAMVTGDQEPLARAVRNLLRNACRYARHRVEVSVQALNGQVELTVADDGPGIPAESREHIFERFTRLDKARARDDGGSGLGLAIVREIVDAHGGQVAAHAAGPGACFVIRLPAARGA